MLSKTSRSGIRLKLWKMKPIFWLRMRDICPSFEAAHVLAVQPVFAAVEGVEQAGDVEEGGLARARGPHDGHELARPHVHGEVGERVGLDPVGPVDLDHFLHVQHEVPSLSPVTFVSAG